MTLLLPISLSRDNNLINRHLLSTYVPDTVPEAVNIAVSEVKKILLSWNLYSTGGGGKISKTDK